MELYCLKSPYRFINMSHLISEACFLSAWKTLLNHSATFKSFLFRLFGNSSKGLVWRVKAQCALSTGHVRGEQRHTPRASLFSPVPSQEWTWLLILGIYFSKFLKEKTKRHYFLPDNLRSKVSWACVLMEIFRSLGTKDKAQYIFSLGLAGTWNCAIEFIEE